MLSISVSPQWLTHRAPPYVLQHSSSFSSDLPVKQAAHIARRTPRPSILQKLSTAATEQCEATASHLISSLTSGRVAFVPHTGRQRRSLAVGSVFSSVSYDKIHIMWFCFRGKNCAKWAGFMQNYCCYTEQPAGAPMDALMYAQKRKKRTDTDR